MAEMGNQMGESWVWDLEFRRDFFHCELDQYQSFLHLLQTTVSTGGVDALFWRGDAMGVYSVKGLCNVLEEKWFCEAGWVVPRLLSKFLPTKVTTFMWQLQRNRVATKDNLMEKGISLPDNGICGLCMLSVESSSHLFLHCSEVWALWCKVL